MNVTDGGNTELCLCHHGIYKETVYNAEWSRYEAGTDQMDMLCVSLNCIKPVSLSSPSTVNSGKQKKIFFSNLNCDYNKSESYTFKNDLAHLDILCIKHNEHCYNCQSLSVRTLMRSHITSMACLFLSKSAILTNIDVVYCHLKPRAQGALKEVFV